MRRAVFLDRDGVLNRAIVRNGKPYPPKTLGEVEIPPGTADALRKLRDAGFLLIVVTNQPDVARGTATLGEVEAIHGFLSERLPLDGFRTCFHDDRDDCPCRKPKPGLITEAAARNGVDLKGSFMIGDRWRDITAGHMAGCRTIFIDYHYDEKRPTEQDFTVSSLSEAADTVLGEGRPSAG